jgi:hypothetical protein
VPTLPLNIGDDKAADLHISCPCDRIGLLLVTTRSQNDAYWRRKELVPVATEFSKYLSLSEVSGQDNLADSLSLPHRLTCRQAC